MLLLAAPALLGSLGSRVDVEDRLLAAHNRERADVGAPPLVWDERLARDAAEWAQELADSGRFEHSPDDLDSEPQGENLWAGTAGHFQPEAMVGLWSEEKRHYRAGTFPDNSVTGRVEDVSHYTQLIWQDTQAVGCAVRKNAREDVLVCRYSNAGNVIGETPVQS